MYFAKPSVIPGLDFYKEVFEALIKHNDRCLQPLLDLNSVHIMLFVCVCLFQSRCENIMGLYARNECPS